MITPQKKFVIAFCAALLVFNSGFLGFSQPIAHATVPVIDYTAVGQLNALNHNLGVNNATIIPAWATEAANWVKDLSAFGNLLGLTGVTNFALNSLVAWAYVLRPLAWAAAKLILGQISQAFVNLVLHGSIGDTPLFIINPYQFFDMLYDRVITSMVNGVINASGLDPTLGNLIAYNIINARTGQYDFFGRSKPNYNPAYERQFAGGEFFNWDAWNAQFSSPQNNPYGAQQMMMHQLQSNFDSLYAQEMAKLQQGQGFSPVDACYKTWNNANILITDPNPTSYLCAIMSPGTTIQNLLATNLDSGRQAFVQAQDIGQLVSAFLEMTAENIVAQGIMEVITPGQDMTIPFNPQMPVNPCLQPNPPASCLGPNVCNQQNPPSYCPANPNPNPNPNPPPGPGTGPTPPPVPPPPPAPPPPKTAPPPAPPPGTPPPLTAPPR